MILAWATRLCVGVLALTFEICCTPADLTAAGSDSMGGTSGPNTSDFATLLISFVVWCLALFLLHDAGRFQKWQSANDDRAPDPLAGIEIAWGVSLGVVILWIVFLMFVLRPREPALITLVFGESRHLVPGILIAALFPAAVAVFKYITTTAAIRTHDGTPGSRSRGLAGALLALINLGASVATLVMFRDYLFGPRP